MRPSRMGTGRPYGYGQVELGRAPPFTWVTTRRARHHRSGAPQRPALTVQGRQNRGGGQCPQPGRHVVSQDVVAPRPARRHGGRSRDDLAWQQKRLPRRREGIAEHDRAPRQYRYESNVPEHSSGAEVARCLRPSFPRNDRRNSDAPCDLASMMRSPADVTRGCRRDRRLSAEWTMHGGDRVVTGRAAARPSAARAAAPNGRAEMRTISHPHRSVHPSVHDRPPSPRRPVVTYIHSFHGERHPRNTRLPDFCISRAAAGSLLITIATSASTHFAPPSCYVAIMQE
jgi:hypothetical protein